MQKLLAAIIGVGSAATVGTLIWAPSAYAPTLAGASGALAGVSLARARSFDKQSKRDTAVRAAAVFSYLYEQNKGVVSPQQMSILSAQPLEDVINFLDALSKAQGGKVINTDQGTVYDFPHTGNVLKQLAANAQAWAKNSTEEVLKENAVLKQQITAMYQAQAVNVPKAPIPQPLKNSEERVDPWQQLL